MRTYTVESIITPIDLVYARNKNEALEKYAKLQSFDSVHQLMEECERACSLEELRVNHFIDIQRISKVH